MLITIVNLGYLGGVIMFILGLRRLSSPQTARAGNLLAAAGMGLAVLVTLILPLEQGGNHYWLILLALVIGSVIGMVSARRVAMTSMPQMVSIFNGLGGACAVAISMVELYNYQPQFESLGADAVPMGAHLTTLLALFIGGVAFTGSILAYGKLDGWINDRKLRLPQPTLINMTLLLGILLGIGFKLSSPTEPFFWVLIIMGVSLIYGMTFVIPIGGADMPVVISLLNAFTGVAAALAGVVYDNQVMLVGGILVGSSGTILTVLMCEAMNRSLWNVIVGGFGSTGSAKAQDGDQVAREITPNDAAILLRYANQVMVVPGYGMAVA
ncbi:MAG: NAD(P)(+) transhydrogenase (Re/Si-specific) subunit beta, partial [Bacteroidota bacterium]